MGRPHSLTLPFTGAARDRCPDARPRARHPPDVQLHGAHIHSIIRTYVLPYLAHDDRDLCLQGILRAPSRNDEGKGRGAPAPAPERVRSVVTTRSSCITSAMRVLGLLPALIGVVIIDKGALAAVS